MAGSTERVVIQARVGFTLRGLLKVIAFQKKKLPEEKLMFFKSKRTSSLYEFQFKALLWGFPKVA